MTTWHKQKMHLFWYSWNVDIMILIIRWAGLQNNSSTWSFTLSECKVSVSPAGWLFRSQPCSDVCVFFLSCHLRYREWEPYARCVLQWKQPPWVCSTTPSSNRGRWRGSVLLMVTQHYSPILTSGVIWSLISCSLVFLGYTISHEGSTERLLLDRQQLWLQRFQSEPRSTDGDRDWWK